MPILSNIYFVEMSYVLPKLFEVGADETVRSFCERVGQTQAWPHDMVDRIKARAIDDDDCMNILIRHAISVFKLKANYDMDVITNRMGLKRYDMFKPFAKFIDFETSTRKGTKPAQAKPDIKKDIVVPESQDDDAIMSTPPAKLVKTQDAKRRRKD